MKKASLALAFLLTVILAGCAIPKNPNNPTLLRQRFLIETLYLDTDIPEPMEIDLKFLNTRSKFEYSKPVYTYERSLSSFSFVKDGITTRIMAMAPRFMKADTNFHPPENANDQEYIEFQIKYFLSEYYPIDPVGEITYDSKKNYGITCIRTKNHDIFHCEAIRITPHRNIIVVETKGKNESADKVQEWIRPVIESVKETGR